MKAVGLVTPEKDSTRSIALDTGTFVQVRLRNGYLETGSPKVNKILPTMLRCTQGRNWINEATRKKIAGIQGCSPTGVVIFFWQQAQQAQEKTRGRPVGTRYIRRMAEPSRSSKGPYAEATLA